MPGFNLGFCNRAYVSQVLVFFLLGVLFVRGFSSAGRASEGLCSRAGLARARYTGVWARFLSSISICIVSCFGKFMFSFSRHLLFALTLVLSHLFVVLGYLFGLAWVGERWFMSCSLHYTAW